MPLCIGIIDSAVTLSGIPLAADRDFTARGVEATGADLLQHGNGVAKTIFAAAPGVQLCLARVFRDRLQCSALQVAEAIHWLTDQGVTLINMSFGLREDRRPLREACETALAAGICLVAAAPAQGDSVYPASYPGVVRATGDARCAPGQISWLDSERADFGGFPGRPESGFAGASAGCAAVTAALARLAVLHSSSEPTELVRHLCADAAYRGPERRYDGDRPA